MSAAETAKKAGFAYATTDADEVLKDPDVHAVFIATRHDSHARYVCAALEAGKAVFVEKPLCLSGEELDAIGAARESAGGSGAVCLAVGFNRRFSSHARLVAEYFRARATPMVVNYRVNAGLLPAGSWIADAAVSGGRIVGEVCHFVDLVTFVTGSPVASVQALGGEWSNARATGEDNVAVALRCADGSLATITYLAVGAAATAKELVEFHADGSTAVIDDFRRTRCEGKLGKRSLGGRQAKGYDEEIADFLASAAGPGAGGMPFDSLVNTTRATFGIRESLATGQRLRVT
jgi:polar amino acid transport system substrate-binding protein